MLSKLLKMAGAGVKERVFATPLMTRPLVVGRDGKFRERDTGRVFWMHGINFASNTKMPEQPCQDTNINAEHCQLYETADTVTFVGKPFPLNEGYQHLSRIKQCGFNTIRLVTTWEAIEHEGPGIYDLEYADYVVNFLKLIEEVGGLYVFIDPHQDVWSRFSGGSGAPIWTLYAAGLEPRNFEKTVAAKLHNLAIDPQKFTKMVWATNYNRLASEVMFTLFFTGSIFTPKAKLNEGENIQNYLQRHFIEAFAFLVGRIKSEIPHIFSTCFLGIESMNEPNSGFYGYGDLHQCPTDQELKLDETPTPIQSMRLGMGYPEEVDMYSVTIFGPSKIGRRWCDPDGVKAWVTETDNKDKHYGFVRSPDWKLGECIFAQHGVWDTMTGELILPDYFKVHPETGEYLNKAKFINGPFLDFWLRFKRRMREVDEDMFLVMQPPVLQIPPLIKHNTEYLDDKTVVALHYYDGMSLLFQKWNRMLNVDTLGIMRGRYLNPVFGLVLGESNIRKSIQQQLKGMETESHHNVGYNVPVIFTETGMPFNMDNKRSYEDGNYDSQEAANDAILSALEKEQLNFTYWCYNPENCHDWGDLWNLEDFSIWSKDDLPGLDLQGGNNYTEWLLNNSIKRKSPFPTSSASVGHSTGSGDTESVNSHSDGSINKELVREITHSYTDSKGKYSGRGTSNWSNGLNIDLTGGIRAVNAIVRPVPFLVNGNTNICEFDVTSKSFHLEILNVKSGSEEIAPSVIVLPERHYPNNNFRIRVSAGTFELKQNPITQWVEWNHSESPDKVVIMDVRIIDELADEAIFKKNDCGPLKAFACGYLSTD